MKPSTRSIELAHDELTAAERLQCARAEHMQLGARRLEMLERGRRMREQDAPATEREALNQEYAELDWRWRHIDRLIAQLELDAENEKHGWTRLSDGIYGKVLPNGKVLSTCGWVSERTDSDGTVYRETPDDQRRRAEQHKAAALAFQASVTAARLRRARRAPSSTCTVRPTATVAAPRERRDSSSSRTSGQDPGDDDPPGDLVYELLLVDEEAPVSQQPPRFCRCERDRPYAAPNWNIGPDGGHCRSCTRTLRDGDVARWHAIARAERERFERKGWR